jgi:hypothetical protein
MPSASRRTSGSSSPRLRRRLQDRTHDEAIAAMLSAIRQLMNPPPPKRRGIGFTANIDEKP